MNKWVGEAHQIAKERGYDITQDDILRMKHLLSHIDFEDEQGQHEAAFVWEGVALIVNDPLYKGDAEPLY